MEFDYSRLYTIVNANKLEAGDIVICANDLGHLKHYVERNGATLELKRILDENCSKRFVVGKGEIEFNLAYLVERKENCTNCRLCNESIKDDAIKVCENYEPQVEPLVKCETCSKADTDRCPVPNPPKKTGCCHWEPKPARVCENCRNLECHGKDNNWCEVRKLKLSDKAIKKNTCGYFKLVKAEPHYRPFRDTDELIKVWEEKTGATPYWGKGADLVMPHIWVRHKKVGSRALITDFVDDWSVIVGNEGNGLRALLNNYTFLDGSTCGVEE